MRRFADQELIIATHNKGKLHEFTTLLAPFVPRLLSASAVALPEPEETGHTFIENALLKARLGAEATGRVVLADDSGLCVTALNDAPGIYTARWCGPEKDSLVGMTRVHEALGNTEDRRAHFVCALALAWPDGESVTVEGRIDGNLCWPPRGSQGHGYDPLFVPVGDDRTFAEMAEDEKNKQSHRARALAALIAQCFAS